MSDSALRELRTFLENDEAIYRSRIVPMVANLDRKVKQGKYDSALAPKLFMYAVDDAAVGYVIDPKPVHKATTEEKKEARRIFPTALRMKLAMELRDSYEEEAPNRGVQINPERHLCGSCAKHEKEEIVKQGEAQLRAFEAAESERRKRARARRHPNF